MKKTIIFLLTFCFLGCSSGVTPPKPIPTTGSCAVADLHLQELGCIPKNQPFTKKGKSFTDFCVETENNGIDLHPDCIANIKSCAEIDACTGSN